MYKKIIYAALLGSILWFSSCKQKAAAIPTAETGSRIYETPEFKQFYDSFSTDSAFQMEHIVFPLEGERRMEDSLDVIPPDFRWQQIDWVLHKPYDDMGGTFTRKMMDVNESLVIELIEDKSGKYNMERRFGKLSSGWHLIYYREMGIH